MNDADRTRMPLNHPEMITAGTHFCKYVLQAFRINLNSQTPEFFIMLD